MLDPASRRVLFDCIAGDPQIDTFRLAVALETVEDGDVT
jgi:hypothetical protein